MTSKTWKQTKTWKQATPINLTMIQNHSKIYYIISPARGFKKDKNPINPIQSLTFFLKKIYKEVILDF